MGLLAILAANIIWGLLPLYWRALGEVPPIQIVFQRLVWAAIALTLLLLALGKLGPALKIFAKPRELILLALASATLSAGWVSYIALINSDRIMEASLGSYISPLVTVALGVVFFKDKPNRLQYTAIALAGQMFSQALPQLPGTHSERLIKIPSSIGERAPIGQAARHLPQPRHFSADQPNSISQRCDSGLQHHVQRSGQPFIKTSVRMPGPS